MAMGQRKDERQDELWVARAQMPEPPGHPFYRRLNQLLSKQGFDAFVEGLCRKFYHEELGRPGIPPGVYFRMLLIGYFEGIDSERGIAWRCADSRTLSAFLGYGLTDSTPDHSSLSIIRRRIDLETHQEVFTWVLKALCGQGLLKGKTLGVDATTLEANAAMRSIVRNDTGESYNDFLTKLAQASGLATPTREDQGDTTTLYDTVTEAAVQLNTVAAEDAGSQIAHPVVRELVADKGYHSNETTRDLRDNEIRTYISEPDRGGRVWIDKDTGEVKSAEQAAVYANRRRIRGDRGKALLRKRGELLERLFAHCYETGAMRRTHLRHHPNILKRLLIHVAGFNLGLLMRKVFGVGKPRCLQDGLAAALWSLGSAILGLIGSIWRGLSQLRAMLGLADLKAVLISAA